MVGFDTISGLQDFGLNASHTFCICSKTVQPLSNDLPFVTDEGNYIIDLHLGRIGDPATLHVTLNQVPGVVENGLFLNMCDLILIGDEDGTVYEKAKEG